MTPARRTARTLRAIAAVSLASGLWAAADHPAYLIPGLIGASVLLLVAASFSHEDRCIRARHEMARRAALTDAQALAQPDPWEQLHAADCCELWWTSCGTAHDRQCARKDQTV